MKKETRSGIDVCCIDYQEAEGALICPLSNANAVGLIRAGRVEYIGSEKELYADTVHMYPKAVGYEQKVFLVPYRAKAIAVVEKQAEGNYGIRRIPIGIDIHNKRRETLFWRAFVYKERLYLLGDSFPGICIFNMNNEEKAVRWFDGVDAGVTQGGFFPADPIIEDKTAYIPLGDFGGFLKLSMETDSEEIIRTPYLNNGIGAISASDDEWFMTGYHEDAGAFVRTDRQTHNYIKIRLFEPPENSLLIFHPPVIYKDRAYIFPFSLWKCYVVDLNTNQAREFVEFEECFWKDENDGLIFVRQERGMLYFQMKLSHLCGSYNLETGEVEKKLPYKLVSDVLRKELLNLEIEKMIEQEGLIREETDYLECFLHCLTDYRWGSGRFTQ